MKKQTEQKLRKMGMGAVADAADAMGGAASSLSKEEWLEILVDRLYDEKMAKKLDNLIKAAHFSQPDAYIEDLITDPDRMLDVGLIDRLAAGEFTAKHHDVVIMGAAGSGKSWLTCALGISACRRFEKVEYVCTQDLVDELLVLRQNPEARKKRMKQLVNRDVLIADDWLCKETDIDALDDMFAVVDKRSRAKRPTVFCSQFLIEGWASRMGGYPDAESIVDRIKNNSYKLELKGEISMRERCMAEELRRNA